MTPKQIANFAAEVYGELSKVSVCVRGVHSGSFTETEAFELTKIVVKAKAEEYEPMLLSPVD